VNGLGEISVLRIKYITRFREKGKYDGISAQKRKKGDREGHIYDEGFIAARPHIGLQVLTV
jgi:hypothetical protein